MFVAGFIGSPAMNFVDGRITVDGGIQVVTGDGIRFNVSSYPFLSMPRSGQEVILGIRPEHLHVPLGNEPTYPTLLEPRRAARGHRDVLLHLGQTDLVASLNPSEVAGAQTDELLPLAINLSKASIFDRASTLRL